MSRDKIKNQAVIAALTPVTNPGYLYAYLITESDQSGAPTTIPVSGQAAATKYQQNTGIPIYRFMYNPETVNWSLPISYTETVIPGTSVQTQIYSHGGNITYSFTNLYLDAYFDQKSLQSLFDTLVSLREPTIVKNSWVTPKILYFKWGTYKTPPCVMTNIDVQATHGLNGEPQRAQLSLTLKEVPPSDSTAANRGLSAVSAPTAATTGNLVKPLSKKRAIDGNTTIQNFLKTTGKNFLTSTATNILKTGSLGIDGETGLVSILASDASKFLNIGTYNGDTFVPSITTA